MARLESKQIMGYLPFEPRHYDAVFSLLAPVTPAYRLLDPFAGEGAFLGAAASAWGMTPYANELDGDRAAACADRFGATQAVRCDAERLIASNGAFSALWCNPPYDHDASAAGNKRFEFRYLRHSWKWLQEGGLCFWVVYQHHITEEAAAFLAKQSRSVDVWALPGKHLGTYDQVIVVAVKGIPLDSEALYAQIMMQKASPRVLAVQAEPVYTLPPPPDAGRKFVFAPDVIDEARGLQLIEMQGAWATQGFQALLATPDPPAQIEPVVAPRPGHMALVLAAGVADGAVIETDEYGTVAIRGKTRHVEQVARVDVESDPNDPDRQVKKTTVRLKPSTTLTLLAGDGTLVEMDGDDALLDFITTNRRPLADYLNNKFNPTYRFDYNGIGHWLGAIRLNGKFPMYTAQKHVVGAITKGFERRKSILLVGSMGSGKTFMGGSAAIAVASGVVDSLRENIRDDQVVLVVAPPHLLEKWKRELHSISDTIYVERLDRHEQVRDFMTKAATLGAGIAKIGLIKRDLTKLGCRREVAVVWREQPVALWRYDQPMPEGYEAHQRITKQRIPTCPHCGSTVMRETKGATVPASENWLKSGKRQCLVCNTPLWQAARGRGSRPKAGEKYPSKNPRYRIDEYIKRRYRDRVCLLVWDEVHECQSADSGNGESFGRLAGIADKVLGMTGTPFNGRASSLFNLEYHMNERIRQRYPWGGADRLRPKERGSQQFQVVIEGNSRQRGRSESRWVAQMGVREMVVEERPTCDSSTGAYTGTSTYQRPYEEAPGISPLLVAEVLDHAIFFGLGDLGKQLPEYDEIAMPVAMDADTYHEYDRTRALLKEYLIQRKWEGDVGFRGAYLQWALGWPNAAHRPHTVIHNMKHPVTGEKTPHIVTKIKSYGEQRIYAKEQALIDLLTSELAAGRPCVVYLRQTGTRDIQPRIEALIREHVPGAQPFILKNTVSAERREKVIEGQVAGGVNVLITNPELVRTGLDLLHFPTLIFAEIIFNLSTMMQAAARSYRLNQTHAQCKVIYLFYEGTMEHTAVQLMSRKQRAAKLLTGDTGLTGLDAITEGEGGFEAALMDAIANDDALLDPAELFTASAGQGEIDAEDAAYWNIEMDANDAVTEIAPAKPVVEPDKTETVPEKEPAIAVVTHSNEKDIRKVQRFVRRYLETVCILSDVNKKSALQAEIIQAMLHGILDDDDIRQVVGMLDADFARYPVHTEQMVRWVRGWLKKKQFVFTGCEDEVAGKAVTVAKQALGIEPLQLDVFEALQDMRDEQVQTRMQDNLKHIDPRPLPPRRTSTTKTLDLLAVPEDTDEKPARRRPLVSAELNEPQNPPKQLTMF